MAGNARDMSKERGFSAPRSQALEGAESGRPEPHHRSLYCIAVGTDPAGREHRIKIREEGTSFAMIDSRRRCRVPAHWARRLAENDIAKEVAFVFHVKVKAFEYPEAMSEDASPRTRQSKAKYWKSWARKTIRSRG